MLALSDEGLSHLAVAASGVAPGQRSIWLEDLSRRFDQEHQRSRGRQNTGAWRVRAAAGQVILKFTIDEAFVAVGLVQHGYLDPTLADSPAALSAAAKRALLELCDRSPHDAEIRDKLRTESLAVVRRKPTHATRLHRAMQRALQNQRATQESRIAACRTACRKAARGPAGTYPHCDCF